MPSGPDDTFEDLVSALEARAFAEGAENVPLRSILRADYWVNGTPVFCVDKTEPAPLATTPAQAPPEAPRRG